METERLPRFNENMESATIVRTLVNEGDSIEVGDVVFEMVTDKAEFEYLSTISGRVIAVLAGDKDEVPVGYALMATGAEDERRLVDGVREENQRILSEFHPGGMDMDVPGEEVAGEKVQAAPAGGGKVRATPGARRLAKGEGADLTAVREALGLEGIVREEHVRAYMEKRRTE
ncbi:MAG: hypothetical protein JW909_11565 [Planctomycetes bacterium]|nr:hypothetical protein [Planctomycetota bacterium]